MTPEPATPSAGAALAAPGAPLELAIEGMHCASCVARVEGALARVPDVDEAVVNLATGRATVRVRAPVALDGLIDAVRRSGYGARPATTPLADDEEQRARRADLAALRSRFAVAAALSLPVFALGMFGMLPPLDRIPLRVQNAIQLALATPVQWWAGWPFVRGIGLAVRRRIADMNLLVGLGTLTAYLFSLAVTVAPAALARAGIAPYTYFDTAVVIVTLILLGRLLEARARAGTSQAMRRLLALQPRVAHRVRPAGGAAGAAGAASDVAAGAGVEDVPLAAVVPGDVLLVRPGERVPVDGVLVAGRSAVDASLVTGESIPVAVAAGDRVHGGAVNVTGAFRMRADRVGADSMVMQIVRLVQQAQGTRAGVARLADRVAAVFVPVVIGIAFAAALAWLLLGPAPRFAHAVQALVAVLIIACPCALGLATPTALMAGTGRGAELGVLLRGAGALESAERIDTVVFDKTGTLTRGRPEVTDVVPATGRAPDQVLALAATAAHASAHPVSGAIVRAARARGIAFADAADASEVPGRGVVALAGGRALLLGSPAFVVEQGASLAALEEARERLEDAGRTVVAIAEGGEIAGLIAVADTLAPEAAATVAALERSGRQVWMITGDHARTARAIAAEAGIAPERVLAEVPPAGKRDRIAGLQRRGARVAMVGDGINDAPALAQADLGIAIGGGTDLAMEAGDMTLVRRDLRGVEVALALARRTMQVIRQNLFWAFAYNTLGIPIAAGVLYLALRPGGPVGPVLGWDGRLHPMIASLAMALSSVSVVTSSLRLRGFRP